MNERIKELAKQSGAMFDHMTWVERDLAPVFERFAELIVAECADIAKHHVMNITTYADADFVDEQIREHFGVKNERRA